MKTIFKINGLGVLHAEPFQTGIATEELTAALLKNNATGNTMRIGQVWATEHEIKVDDTYYTLKVYDNRSGAEIRTGSSL